MYDVIPPPVATLIHQKIHAALDSGNVQSVEYQLETVSGQTYFEARLVPIGPDEVISVARDVTQRKLAEAERERLISDLDAFSHTVAHDLKNPLQGIVGYASLLVSDINQFSTADVVRYLQVITQYGERMSAIINELLLLATVRKQGDIVFGTVDMARVIANVLLRLDYLIRQRNAEITVGVIDWPAARGYAPWIEEVWANYISNAIKYGGKPPCVELGADPQGEQIRFWVRDNGSGIPLDKTGELFTEFKRVEPTHLEGYGLGLSIVRRVIDRLGGEVGVESTPGHGSTFFFTLLSAPKPENPTHE
jgi:signal transduction histidine kinase